MAKANSVAHGEARREDLLARQVLRRVAALDTDSIQERLYHCVATAHAGVVARNATGAAMTVPPPERAPGATGPRDQPPGRLANPSLSVTSAKKDAGATQGKPGERRGDAHVRTADPGRSSLGLSAAIRYLATLPHAPVAQVDRAAGFEPVGREFESLRARSSRRACPFGIQIPHSRFQGGSPSGVGGARLKFGIWNLESGIWNLL